MKNARPGASPGSALKHCPRLPGGNCFKKNLSIGLPAEKIAPVRHRNRQETKKKLSGYLFADFGIGDLVHEIPAFGF
jgi:hypothetical protein